MVKFFERVYFNPKWYDWGVIFLLAPFSFLYGGIALFRRIFKKKESFSVPIISIGNLIVGGTGKSPFLISLIKSLKVKKKIFVISRGYKRKSKDLVVVSANGKILASLQESGDEPFLIAKSLPEVGVIVSKNRKEAIKKALELGAEIIFLDDGFGRVEIKKFEILLEPKQIKNPFPFPAGGFREFWFTKYFANLNLKEEKDFFRDVKVKNPKPKMVLATAISNPKRLNNWLDEKKIVYKYYLNDHAWFEEKKLKELLEKFKANSILTTQKDFVKIEKFNLPISLLDLEIKISPEVLEKIEKYIKDFDAKKD
jgi:tetraacyldisaccharide 4'-kinase